MDIVDIGAKPITYRLVVTEATDESLIYEHTIYEEGDNDIEYKALNEYDLNSLLEYVNPEGYNNKNRPLFFIIVTAGVALLVLIIAVILCLFKKRIIKCCCNKYKDRDSQE